MTATPSSFDIKADVIRLAGDRPALHAMLERLATWDRDTFVTLVGIVYALDRRVQSEVR